ASYGRAGQTSQEKSRALAGHGQDAGAAPPPRSAAGPSTLPVQRGGAPPTGGRGKRSESSLHGPCILRASARTLHSLIQALVASRGHSSATGGSSGEIAPALPSPRHLV